MSKIQVFIQKLWSGELSPEEAVELNELLGNEAAALRDELNNSFNQTVGKQLTTEEYNEASEMLGKLLIKIEMKQHKRGKVLSMVRSSMGWAAALIVLAFTGALIYLNSSKQTHTLTAAENIKNTSSLRSVTNSSNDKMRFTLKDSSVVTLFPNSTVSYNDFNENVRNIRLEGMACFKVAKNTQKPFIVLSAGYTTTAIGTEFSVDSRKAGKVKVKLYEGKVVVRPVNKDLHFKEDVYLTPMQSFTVNITTGEFAVNKFNTDKFPPAFKKNKNPAPKMANADLDFNNEPLKNVFDKLNEKFSAKIKYNESQINDLHFTGTIFKTDSIKTIISIISKMNGLTFEEQGGYIMIRQNK